MATPIRALALTAMVSIFVAQPALADENLQRLVDQALEQNPELEAMEARIQALEYKATRAGAWQDPKLQVAYQNAPVDSLALGREPMTMVMVRFEQTVPMFGKTGDREAVVQKAAEAEKWSLEQRKDDLRLAVKSAYYRLALSRQLETITREHIGLVEQLLDAVRIKYEVGKAAQHDLLRLQLLRDRLKDELEDFARQDVELTAAVNAALHREVETPIETPDALALDTPTVTLEEIRGLALEANPALKALDVNSQMHRVEADLAEYEAVPDPTLFASYGIRTELPNGNPGRDLVTFGVGMPLPLFYGSRNAAMASESRERARAADASREAAVDEIARSLSQALATWTRAAAQVRTYRDHLVPDAHRALDATFSSFQVDRADFVSLFDAEVELLTFEKTIRSATAQGAIARATIEQIVGRDLP